MVQREVAERIVSGPHSRQAGFLSIFCQFFGRPEILFHVPPGAFFPAPKVDSSVFCIPIDLKTREIGPELWRNFFAFVDKGFSQRRKMVVNALGAASGNKDIIAESLRLAGIPETVRAEDISVEEWIRLFIRVKKTSESIPGPDGIILKQ
jgi:16S rRNA (adenine1518-N6/adenine1519-N6)-dimethyltransferase